MNTKTMEGIVGARTNMNLMNTPMRVFKEARRKGDTATMERAMGYVNDFSDKAQEYKAKADEGMEEDAKETREKAKLQCEEAIRKRKEEREIPDPADQYLNHSKRKYHGQQQAGNTHANSIVDTFPNHHLGQLLCCHTNTLHGCKFMLPCQNRCNNGIY